MKRAHPRPEGRGTPRATLLIDDETPIHIIDRKLTEAHAASDGRAVQVLARYGMTRCIKDNFPDATYAKMGRFCDQLELVGLADRLAVKSMTMTIRSAWSATTQPIWTPTSPASRCS